MTIQSEIQALKCADCARSDSAVSDLKPDSMLPIPADALTGWSDGTTGFGRHHAPQAAAQRRARLRSRVRGDAALVRGGLGIGRRAGRGADAAEHRRRLPQRRQRRPQLLRAARHREYAKYQSLRPTIARVLGDGTGAHGRHDDHAQTPAATLAFSNKLVSGTGADRNGDTKGFDTLYGDGTGGRRIRSRDHPGGRLQPAQPLALREPRLLVRRCARAAPDRLAGTLAGQLRLRHEPAAGGLARLQPVQADPLAEGARVRARGPQGVGFGVRASPPTSTARSASWPPCRSRPATTPCPLARHDGPHGRRGRPPLDSQRRARWARLPAQQRSLAEAAARGDAALGGPRHAHHHDRLGQLRHAWRPDRRAGSAAHHALARAGRVQGRPGRPRRRAARS